MMEKVCEYCKRNYITYSRQAKLQMYCSKTCYAYAQQAKRCYARRCWRCGLKLYDSTGSTICKSCRQFLNRKFKMPKLSELTADELFNYGKTQAKYIAKGVMF